MNNNTPDTEWEKEFDEKFNKAFCCDHDHYGEECGKEFATKCKSFIKKTLTSRDTYWKERVRKEVEETQKVVKDLLPIMWNDDAEKHASNIRLTNNLHIISKALDTLLDTLK